MDGEATSTDKNQLLSKMKNPKREISRGKQWGPIIDVQGYSKSIQ